MHPSGNRSSIHEQVLRACADSGFQPTSILEVAETATPVVFVAAGLGVAVVREPVRSLGLTGVAYVPLTRAHRSTSPWPTHQRGPSRGAQSRHHHGAHRLRVAALGEPVDLPGHRAERAGAHDDPLGHGGVNCDDGGLSDQTL
jgi:hypothetical protein